MKRPSLLRLRSAAAAAALAVVLSSGAAAGIERESAPAGDEPTLLARSAEIARVTTKTTKSTADRPPTPKEPPARVQRERDFTSMGRYNLTIRRSPAQRTITVPAKTPR